MIDFQTALLAGVGFAAYLIESVFGFGGTVIFVGASGWGVDVHKLVYVAVYASATASLVIMAQSWQHIAWVHWRRIFIITLPGIIVGNLLIDVLSGVWLLKFFAMFLIVYACQGLLVPQFNPPAMLRHVFVALGGVMQGMYSTGGPFVLMGYKDNFTTKTQLRATMAVFFLVANIWRFTQALVTGSTMPATIAAHWWVAIPVVMGVLLGHGIHVRISEQVFKRGILVLLLIVGASYLLR